MNTRNKSAFTKAFSIHFSIKTIATLALFIALGIVLSIFGRIIVVLPLFGQFRISFVIIILILIGSIVNPPTAFIAGLLVDVLGFFIGSSSGIFHLGFTLNAGLTAAIASMVLGITEAKVKTDRNYAVFWYSVTSFMVFLISILIILINPLGIQEWILAIVAILSSIIALSFLFLIAIKKAARFLPKIFLIFFLILVNTFLSSLWLEQLFGLPYSTLLWPRLVKNIVFDWWIISIICIPLFVLIKKSNYSWWVKK